MTLPDMGAAWFQEHLASLTAGQRFPHTGTLELTWRCNFRCQHCYLEGSRDRPREMPADQVVALLDQIADAGCLTLTLTGGEPLLRDDFESIQAAAVGRGFLVSLFTNASLIDRARARILRRHPPRLVEVTLYGASGTTYERVTGAAAHFQAALDGLDRLLDDGHLVKLKAMLLSSLADDAAGMLDLAKERGLSVHFDAMIDATLDRGRKPMELRLEPERAAALLTLDPDRKQKLLDFCGQPRAWGLSAEQRGCGAGLVTFNVDPAGRLTPCLLLREPAFDTHALGFQAAWQQLGEAPRVLFSKDSPCLRCDLVHLCSHCPGHERVGDRPPKNREFFACKLSRRLRSVLECAPDPGERDR